MAPSEIQVWNALHGITSDWLAFAKTAAPGTGATISAIIEEPPQLELHSSIPNIRHELQQLQLKSEEVEECAAIFEKSLLSTSLEMQTVFQQAWKQVPDCNDVKAQGQNALVALYQNRFEEAVISSKYLALNLANTHRQVVAEVGKGDDGTAEWTEETRALMERVYQQHPKLEAHEKKLLSEASGLSLRQISIWFANQRQRKGWPVVKQEQQEIRSDSIVEEPEEKEEEEPVTLSKSSLPASQSSSTSSSSSSILERSPSPLTPFSANSACPSLSSSTSSRSSSDSYACSPTRAYFHPHHQDVVNQLPTFDFNNLQQQDGSTASSSPVLDIDQLIRPLTPPQASIPEGPPSLSIFNPCIPTFMPTPPSEKVSSGPFALFKNEDEDATMSGCGGSTGSGESTPPSMPGQDTFQWLPINMAGLLPKHDTTLSQSQSMDDFTPQAAQFTFAPLRLDTSSYLQQSPSHNVDLSSVVNSFDADGFWNNFMSANNLPQMPSGLAPMPAQQKQADAGITIAQPDANWSDMFLKDMETWGKQPQQAHLQLQF